MSATEVTIFESGSYPPSERRAVIEAKVRQVFTAMRVSEVKEVPLDVNINSVQLPNTILTSFDSGPVMLERTPEHLRDADDRFSLVTCTGGTYSVLTPTRERIPIMPGMAGLISHRLPGGTVAEGANSEKTLVFPREFLNKALHNPDDLIGAVPEGGMVAIRLLASYMGGLLNEPNPIPRGLQSTIEGHVLDLLANAYDPTGEWAHAEPNGGVKAARLQAILAYVAQNFVDQKISAERLGTEYGVSPRQIHNILATTGRTLSQHLLEHRLQAARTALQNPRYVSKRVSEIAFDVGFKDISYFNRSFKSRFGGSPTSFRPESH